MVFLVRKGGIRIYNLNLLTFARRRNSGRTQKKPMKIFSSVCVEDVGMGWIENRKQDFPLCPFK